MLTDLSKLDKNQFIQEDIWLALFKVLQDVIMGLSPKTSLDRTSVSLRLSLKLDMPL